MNRKRSPRQHLPRLLLLPLLASLTSSPSRLEAQDTRTVQGVVRDSNNGEAIVHAAIQIAGTGRQVNTNADGFFTVAGAPRETFTLRIVHIGASTSRLLHCRWSWRVWSSSLTSTASYAPRTA